MHGEQLSLQHGALLEVNGNKVLLFSVLKASGQIFQTSDGRTVKRNGLSTVPVHAEELLFEQRERQSREYDSEFVDAAAVTDLDLDLLRSISTGYLAGMTPELYLQQMGLAEYAPGGLRLRRAAVMLFAKDIATWHPRSQVRILRVHGTDLQAAPNYNVTSQEVVKGNVFNLQVTAWEALRPFLTQATSLGPDARFEQRYLYPELACREALVNAITHRDYTIQNSVDVFVFDDRMEIRSPGGLLSTISIEALERLEGVHESRNALIARCLREAGFVQELGEGMRRIFKLMQESALQQPRLVSDSSSFVVTLYHRSVFSEQQLVWLRMFEKWPLNQAMQRIIVAGMNSRRLSPDDIYTALNSRDRDLYDRTVTYLRQNGLLLEVRQASQAAMKARRTRADKGSIERFIVTNPYESPPSGRVMLRRVPPSLSDAVIRKALEQFGEVTYFQMTRRKEVRGLVIFRDPNIANQVAAQHNIAIKGDHIAVSLPPQYTSDTALLDLN